jgi:hypothetical protein
MKISSLFFLPPTFNILSLGERGSGKTVFLVGSYAEFQKTRENSLEKQKASDSQNLWFECQHHNEKSLLNDILQYVLKKGVYPPPTLKITDFHFAFKQKKSDQSNILCFIRWWDMPGEFCNFNNPYYQEMGTNSQGCCVFIDANRLVNDPTYTENLTKITSQLTILLSLVQDVEYPFSLIFTQCDLLPPGEIGQKQITDKCQDLITTLDKANINYQCFYSAITISGEKKEFRLISKDVSSVFLWLVTKLYEDYQGGKLPNLKIASILHCFRCGSNRMQPSQRLGFFKKFGFWITLRKKYRCRDCGASKIEFLPFTWFNKFQSSFRSSKKRKRSRRK